MIESVRKAVEKYEARLPDFVYVPVVSPFISMTSIAVSVGVKAGKNLRLKLRFSD